MKLNATDVALIATHRQQLRDANTRRAAMGLVVGLMLLGSLAGLVLGRRSRAADPIRSSSSPITAERPMVATSTSSNDEHTARPGQGLIGKPVCHARSGVFLGHVVVDIDGSRLPGVPTHVDGDGLWSGSTVVVQRDHEYARIPLETITIGCY
jgi:hypothetical protein